MTFYPVVAGSDPPHARFSQVFAEAARQDTDGCCMIARCMKTGEGRTETSPLRVGDERKTLLSLCFRVVIPKHVQHWQHQALQLAAEAFVREKTRMDVNATQHNDSLQQLQCGYTKRRKAA